MKPSKWRAGAEAIAAIIGPARLLAKKTKPISAADGNRALRVPKLIEAEVQAFLERTRPERSDASAAAAKLDYFETLELVSQPSDVLADRLPELLQDIVNPDLAHETGDVLLLGCEYLRSVIPRASEETLLGTKSLEPSRVEWGTFCRQWAIANDPMLSLRLLNEEILVDDEVAALAQLYPVIYGSGMRATVVAELAAKAAAEEGWEPRHEQRRQLEVLLQASPVDEDFARELQEINQAASKAEGLRTSPLSIDIKGMELPAQRLQAR